MGSNENSTLDHKSHQTGADRVPDPGGIKPALPVQAGLRAGLQDSTYGNDAARGFGALSAAADFLADWFS